MAEQVEKAYQKQPIFQNTKISKSKKSGDKEKRWYKVGARRGLASGPRGEEGRGLHGDGERRAG